MDGLNENWEKYGCNEHDAIIGMAYNTSSGGLNYWVTANGVKYAGFTISSSAGLVGELQSGSVGVIYVIAPDRTFTRTDSPGFYGAEPPYYFNLLEQGGCQPHNCDPVAINHSQMKSINKNGDKILLNGINLEKINISRSGFVSLNIIDIKGRNIKSILQDFKSKGTHNINFNFKDYSNGTYFINLKVDGIVTSRKVAIFR